LEDIRRWSIKDGMAGEQFRDDISRAPSASDRAMGIFVRLERELQAAREELDETKQELDEARRRIAELEKRLGGSATAKVSEPFSVKAEASRGTRHEATEATEQGRAKDDRAKGRRGREDRKGLSQGIAGGRLLVVAYPAGVAAGERQSRARRL
jgi:uncharacterized membrane-anchored protein YhcB (DUF1043 family)